MSMGDCLLPMAHRFQAECTRPQKDGTGGVWYGGEETAREKKNRGAVISVYVCSPVLHEIKPCREEVSFIMRGNKKLGVWGGLNLHMASLEPDLI